MKRFISRHWKALLSTSILVALIVFGWIYRKELDTYLDSDSQKTYQNYIVEIVSGLLFAILPGYIGLHIGKKLKELQFYRNIKGFLSTLVKLRLAGLIHPETVRLLVKNTTSNFGNETIKKEWTERVAKEISQQRKVDTRKCRICDLDAEVDEDKRCEHCGLNLYAWDLTSQTEEERQYVEIDRIRNQYQARNQ